MNLIKSFLITVAIFAVVIGYVTLLVLFKESAFVGTLLFGLFIGVWLQIYASLYG